MYLFSKYLRRIAAVRGLRANRRVLVTTNVSCLLQPGCATMHLSYNVPQVVFVS